MGEETIIRLKEMPFWKTFEFKVSRISQLWFDENDLMTNSLLKLINENANIKYPLNLTVDKSSQDSEFYSDNLKEFKWIARGKEIHINHSNIKLSEDMYSLIKNNADNKKYKSKIFMYDFSKRIELNEEYFESKINTKVYRNKNDNSTEISIVIII